MSRLTFNVKAVFCLFTCSGICKVSSVSLELDVIAKAIRNVDLKFQKGTFNFETKIKGWEFQYLQAQILLNQKALGLVF